LGSCQYDSQCNERPHGYCTYVSPFGGPFSGTYTCSYGCVRDEECGMGQICECGSQIGQCVQATCSVDSQCGPGFNCQTYVPNPGCPGEAYACQGPADQCAADADCPMGSRCSYQSGHRTCTTSLCAVGRPFLVDGAARTAPRTSGTGWIASVRPNAEMV